MSFPRGFTLQAQAVGPAGGTAAAAQVSVPAIPGAAPVVTAIEAQLWTPQLAIQTAQNGTNSPADALVGAVAGVQWLATNVRGRIETYAATVGIQGPIVYLKDGAAIIHEYAVVIPPNTIASDSVDVSGSPLFAATLGNSLEAVFSQGAGPEVFQDMLLQYYGVTQRTPQIEWSPDGGTTWNGLGTLQTPEFSDYSYSGELFGTPDLALDVAFSAAVAPRQTQTLVVQGYYV